MGIAGRAVIGSVRYGATGLARLPWPPPLHRSDRLQGILPPVPTNTASPMTADVKDEPAPAVPSAKPEAASASALTDQEKLKLRQERFGVQAPTTFVDKKKAREARFGSEPAQKKQPDQKAPSTEKKAALSQDDTDKKLQRQARFGTVEEPAKGRKTKQVDPAVAKRRERFGLETSKPKPSTEEEEKKRKREERFGQAATTNKQPKTETEKSDETAVENAH
ncbi:uncharacterized protein BJ171DRAFT_571629 [Polychytrium aggregatum]|uniref:uncharacterized protein n=1 Tax=Polychytrium aggregatum TaxID=110093 RepID=UPI0022FE7708|nr:uncharacterized protein BJ171DRAFT_571629 [Polychytrium aggregatum]KAI9193601.1 hypothetical protein BJ171DRAFT_571629 [Polychytrium aggregatum]